MCDNTMDRFETFQVEHICPANEAISDVAMMLGGAAFMIGSLKVIFHISKKRNSDVKAKSQNAYFEAHEIPLEQRKTYGKKIVSDVRSNFESAMKQIVANKKKSGLNKVEASIVEKIKEYVTDGSRDVQVDAYNVKFTYNFSCDRSGSYDALIDATYKGNGFIPEDNVYEIAQYAFRPIVSKVVQSLSKEYSEEIQCKLVEIKLDNELASVVIAEP